MISAHWHTLPIIVFAMFLIKNILTDTIKLGYLAGEFILQTWKNFKIED